jgi:hypothetical protein
VQGDASPVSFLFGFDETDTHARARCRDLYENRYHAPQDDTTTHGNIEFQKNGSVDQDTRCASSRNDLLAAQVVQRRRSADRAPYPMREFARPLNMSFSIR